MAMAVLKVNGLLVAIARSSPPLFCRTRPIPSRPTTLPPIESVPVEQVIWTLETLAVAVPAGLATVQVCGGLGDRGEKETLYGFPVAMGLFIRDSPLPLAARY